MSDDQPLPHALRRIATWPHATPGWLDFCEERWIVAFGRTWHAHFDGEPVLCFATGGWSGNESIVAAMRENVVLWSLHWRSSQRGGLHVFYPASSFAKENA